MPAPLNTKAEQRTLAQVEAEIELQKKRNELARQKIDFVTKRTNDLANQGMDDISAYNTAEKEFNDQFLKPMTNEFGEVSEKAPAKGIVSYLGTPGIDIKSVPAKEIKPVGTPTIPELIKGAVGPQRTINAIGKELAQATTSSYSEPDWSAIEKQVGDKNEVSALKSAYLEKRKNNVTANPDDLLASTITELQDLPNVLSGKGDMVKGEVRRGLEDPLYQAFVLQKKEGSVPNLSPVQMAYMDKQIKIKREEAIASKEKELAGKTKKVMILSSGKQINPADYDPQVDGAVSKTVDVPLTKEDIAAYAVGSANLIQPEVWWTDPAKKPEVLADPNKFNKSGFFETTTPFGETQETAQSWLLRSALTIPNLVAGTVAKYIPSPAALASDVTTEDVDKFKREAREKDQPVFKDSPVLFNVARNLSFTGEAQQTANALEERGLMTPTGAKLYTGAGFVADLLDPTFGLIGGVAKAGKTASTVAKTSKLLTGEAALGRAAKVGLQAGLAEAIDITIPVFGSKLSEKVSPGDVRILLANDLTNSVSARRFVIDELDAGRSAEEAVKSATKKFGNNTYVKQATKDIAIANETERLAALEKLEATPLGKTISSIDEYVDSIRAIVADETNIFSKTFRPRDLARDISATAAINPEVKAVLTDLYANNKNVDIRDIVKAIDDAGLTDQVVGHHIFSRALTTVVENSKDIKDAGNLVQVTPNVWASKKDITKILSLVADTEIGKLAADIRTGLANKTIEIRTGVTSRGINQYYVLPEEVAKRIDAIQSQFKDTGRASRSRLARIKDTTSYEISTRDFRNLINAQIDSLAEGSRLALPARDVKRLGASRQIDLLEPLENRSLAQSTVKDWIRLDIPKEANISVAQRQAFNRARNETNSMDIKLRKDITRLRNDSNLRIRLSAPDDIRLPNVKLSLEDAIGYLTVGRYFDDDALKALAEGLPESSLERSKKIQGIVDSKLKDISKAQDLADTLQWSANRYATSKKVTESLTDALIGTKVDFSGSYLNSLGKEKLDSLALDYAQRMRNKPSEYKKLWEEFHTEWRRLLTQDSSLLVADIRPGNLVWLSKEGTIPSELYVAGYYKQESKRIIRKAIDETLSDDLGAGSSLLPKKKVVDDINDIVENSGDADNISAKLLDNEIWAKFVKSHAAKLITNSSDVVITTEEMLKELSDLLRLTDPTGESSSLLRLYDSNPVFARQVSDLLAEADDTARTIVQRNNFQIGTTNVEDEVRRINELFDASAGSEDDKLLQAFFGQDAYKEVKNLVTANKMDHIDKWFTEQAKIAEAGYPPAKLYEGASRFMRKIQELRYTYLLGMRPRFHGVNIMTAPLIAYSTIGQNPLKTIGLASKDLDALTSINILKSQALGADSPAWNKIAITDKAGRTYTNGEIWESVISGGGVRSAASFSISEAMIDNTLRMLPREKIPMPDSLKEGLKQMATRPVGAINTGSQAVATSTANFANYMDNYFRLNTAVAALREGRSLEEATTLARRALFDYADMTETERWISSRMTMFYAFKRQNFKQLLVNMASPKGWSRITTILKTEKGLEKLFGDEPENPIYLQDYTNFRTKFKIKPGVRKDSIFLGPSVPTNEAILSLANLLSGKFPDEMIGTLQPELLMVFDVEKYPQTTNKLQPQHAILFQVMPSVFEAVLGPIVAVPGTLEEGAVDGKLYPLTGEQEATYTQLLKFGNFLGTSTGVKDYAKIIGNIDELPVGEHAGQFIGFYTVSKQEQSTNAEIRQTQKRIEEINKRIKELEESKASKLQNR
jgi:hypothetical protein